MDRLIFDHMELAILQLATTADLRELTSEFKTQRNDLMSKTPAEEEKVNNLEV